MSLSLIRPICVFDLETTGTQVSQDRIVEICIHRVNPDGSEQTKTWRVNPGVPIPPETSAIHGIYQKDIEDKPSFRELAPEIDAFIDGCDLAGYNSNRFDIPMLAEEMLRNGRPFDMSKRRAVDVQNIFHKQEQRTLVAAYKFYCDKELVNAHSAEADVLATWEVLKAQVARYDDLQNDVPFLADFSTRRRLADMAGYLHYNNDGKITIGFGKHRGRLLDDIIANEPGYLGWILDADFPLYTKQVLREEQGKALQAKFKS